MKHHSSSRLAHAARQRGSVLILCMVLAGLGAIGTAAFFSLIRAKSQEALERETAMNRRVRGANSRVLAKEVLFRDHLGATSAPAGGAQTFTLDGGWGKAVVSTHPAAPLASATATRLNKSGFIAPLAFTEDISVTLDDGSGTYAYQAQAKSFHPALGGDLLVVQRPRVADAVLTQFTGNLSVKGRAVFYQGNYSAATSPLRADRILKAAITAPPTSMLNTAGAAILPDNGAFPRLTSGMVGASVDLEGRIQVNGNPNSAINDYSDFVSLNGGASIIGTSPYITTEAPATSPPNINDILALNLIGALISPLPPEILATLSALGPLSSQTITALIGKSTLVDSTLLTSILTSNGPLPLDILNLIIPSTSPFSANDRWAIIRANPVGIAYDGAGTLYADLDSSVAESVAISLTGSFQQIYLRGQTTAASQTAAASLTPIVLSLSASSAAPGVGTVYFEGQNTRPLILAISQNGNVARSRLQFTGTTAFPRWRALVETDTMALDVDTSAVSAATLVGGIRTDRSIDVVAGSLTLERETSATAISALQNTACRAAWLEIYNIP